MDVRAALDALTPLLPWGARWLALAWWGVGAALAGWLACAATVAIAGAPLRRLRGRDVHWTERARLGYPAAVAAATFGLVLPVCFGLVASVSNAISALPVPALGLAAGASVYLAALPRLRALSREILGGPPHTTFARAALGEWTGYLLVLPQFFVMVWMCVCVGPVLDALDAVQIAIGIALFAVASWSAGLPLLRLLGVARRGEPPLREIVAEVSDRTGVAVAAVWVVDWPWVNAIALPWSRQVVFTRRALAELDREEIAAITAHELGHLSEPAAVKLARSAAAFALLPIGVGQPIVARFGVAGLVAAALLAYATLLAVIRVARRMERRADEIAHESEDRRAYARALEKAYRANGTPAVTPSKRPLHPHLYDRLLAAGVQPDYPRPAPPSRPRRIAALACAYLLSATAVAAIALGPRIAVRYEGDPQRAALYAAIAGDSDSAYALGVIHGGDEDPEQAIAWLGLSHALDGSDHHAGAYAAELAAYHGRCEPARAWLAAAEARANEEDRRTCEWLEDARDAVARCYAETQASAR